MIKAIIFDCFGVLYPDTFWGLVRKFNHGIDEREFHDLIRQCDMGITTRDGMWDATAELLGMSRDELDIELKKFGGIDDDMMSFIAQLRDRGYRIGMISNVGRGFIDKVFTGYDPQKYFDDIVLSNEVGLLKPDPAIYKLSASNLEVDTNQCIFIDDIPKNAEGATATGMQGIVYKSLAQTKQDIEAILEAKEPA